MWILDLNKKTKKKTLAIDSDTESENKAHMTGKTSQVSQV